MHFQFQFNLSYIKYCLCIYASEYCLSFNLKLKKKLLANKNVVNHHIFLYASVVISPRCLLMYMLLINASTYWNIGQSHFMFNFTNPIRTFLKYLRSILGMCYVAPKAKTSFFLSMIWDSCVQWWANLW